MDDSCPELDPSAAGIGQGILATNLAGILYVDGPYPGALPTMRDFQHRSLPTRSDKVVDLEQRSRCSQDIAGKECGGRGRNRKDLLQDIGR